MGGVNNFRGEAKFGDEELIDNLLGLKGINFEADEAW
jgi:hypothetical protein